MHLSQLCPLLKYLCEKLMFRAYHHDIHTSGPHGLVFQDAEQLKIRPKIVIFLHEYGHTYTHTSVNLLLLAIAYSNS